MTIQQLRRKQGTQSSGGRGSYQMQRQWLRSPVCPGGELYPSASDAYPVNLQPEANLDARLVEACKGLSLPGYLAVLGAQSSARYMRLTIRISITIYAGQATEAPQHVHANLMLQSCTNPHHLMARLLLLFVFDPHHR